MWNINENRMHLFANKVFLSPSSNILYIVTCFTKLWTMPDHRLWITEPLEHGSQTRGPRDNCSLRIDILWPPPWYESLMLVRPASFKWMALCRIVCGWSLCCASWSWTNLPITVEYMAPDGLYASREIFHNNCGGACVTSHSRSRITTSYCIWNENVWLWVGHRQCYQHWIRRQVDCILFFHLLKWADFFKVDIVGKVDLRRATQSAPARRPVSWPMVEADGRG